MKSKQVRINLSFIDDLRQVYSGYSGDDRALVQMALGLHVQQARGLMPVLPIKVIPMVADSKPLNVKIFETESVEANCDDLPADDSDLD